MDSSRSWRKLEIIYKKARNINTNKTKILKIMLVTNEDGPYQQAFSKRNGSRPWKLYACISSIVLYGRQIDAAPCAELKVGFHYPSSRAELTARELGCIFWHPSNRTPVYTARVQNISDNEQRQPLTNSILTVSRILNDNAYRPPVHETTTSYRDYDVPNFNLATKAYGTDTSVESNSAVTTQASSTQQTNETCRSLWVGELPRSDCNCSIHESTLAWNYAVQQATSPAMHGCYEARSLIVRCTTIFSFADFRETASEAIYSKQRAAETYSTLLHWMNEWIYLSTQKQNSIGLETELSKIQSVDRTPKKAMPPLTEDWWP